MSFTSYAAQAECAPHLQFPLMHPAPSGLAQHMPFPPKPFMEGAPRSNPPSFTLSPSIEFASGEELDLLEPAMKKHKAAKPDVPKRVQFHPFKLVLMVIQTEVPESKQWRKVPIRSQRADEDGVLYPRYWAKLAHHKNEHKKAMRSYVEQGCRCKKDNGGKDSVCHYCSRVHSRVMLKNHERDEDDLGMKLGITSCSALCAALDLRGLPPASPRCCRCKRCC